MQPFALSLENDENISAFYVHRKSVSANLSVLFFILSASILVSFFTSLDIGCRASPLYGLKFTSLVYKLYLNLNWIQIRAVLLFSCTERSSSFPSQISFNFQWLVNDIVTQGLDIQMTKALKSFSRI